MLDSVKIIREIECRFDYSGDLTFIFHWGKENSNFNASKTHSFTLPLCTIYATILRVTTVNGFVLQLLRPFSREPKSRCVNASQRS